ncbi:A-kinase anchor protein 17A-like isoform X1 [Diachasmimorpha longicaudata]|uniref:A-kinase anchor protein 17A-like isoform X1 n=2 Tax=Diachasmimorpha longicaudata TaxID=58733 RepID=UPI0030B8FEE1
MSDNSGKVGETSSGEVVNGIRSCRDLSDIVPLYVAKGLYLKPIAKVNVSVNLPQLKTPGKPISTWEVMEKIRLLIRPDEFASLKVTKSTLEFVRLEGELTDRSRLQRALSRLEGQRINLAGFSNVLKVRAVEAKDDFPTKHSWDSYFRDAKHMNELKPGERPDTVHITGLPVKWFSEDEGQAPSEQILMKMFKKWGTLRRIDVPAADSYRSRMRLGNNIQKCSFGDGIFFDVYVQFIEYMDFVKLMDSLRGMKIIKKEGQSCLTAQIKVDFDKTKHMSDSSVAHREFERKRLIAQDSLAAEKLRRKEEAEVQRREEQKKKEVADKDAKESRRRKREEKRKRKALTRFRKQEEDKVSLKIAREERKLINAQRQLESIRLLDELFDRIKTKVEKKEIVIGGMSQEDQKPGQKADKVEETSNKLTDRDDKKMGKKNKKLKKKKSKKEKKRKKKNKKDSESSNDDSDVETDKKKLRSALGSNNTNSMEVDPELAIPPMYPRFPQPWFYDAAAMLYPPMSRGGGGPMNRYQRGRGRSFPRRGGRYPRSMRTFNPHMYNEQYYKYFANLAGIDYYESDYNSKSRSRSRGRSRSRSRSRSRRRTRSRSYSRSRSRSREHRRRRRSSSRSRSCSRSRSRRSRSRKKSRSVSRSPSRESKRQSRRKRSRSKVKVTRAKSRSTTPKRKSRSKSWSMPKSPRQRSCSWSKNVDEAVKGSEGGKATSESKTADTSKQV